MLLHPGLIQGRFAGEIHELFLGKKALNGNQEMHYTTPKIELTLDRNHLQIRKATLGKYPKPGHLSLQPLAILWTLLQGIQTSMSYLPYVEA